MTRSDRERVEEALRLSEQKYEAVFRASPHSITLTSMKTGRLIDVNSGTEELFGYCREELLGHTTVELNIYETPADRGMMVDALEADGVLRGYPIRVRRKSGEFRDTLVHARVIELQGERVMVALATDVTEQVTAQKALRASEEKYAAAFRSTPDSVSLTILQTGEIVDANMGTSELLGFPMEELIGSTTIDLGIWCIPEERQALAAALKERGGVKDFEIHMKRKDGTIRDALVYAAILDVGDDPLMLAVTRDVTEQRAMQRALRESEEKYSAAFHTCPDLITITRMEDGLFIDVNDGFTLQLGWSADEVRGKTVHDLGIWTDVRERNDFVGLLKAQGVVRDFEAHIRRKDGAVTLALVSASVMDMGGEHYLLSLYKDVTRERAADQALLLSEARLRAAQRVGKMGAWEWHPQTDYIYWSDENYRIFGIEPGTPPSMELWLDRLAPGERERVQAAIEATLNGAPYDLDMRILPDGVHELVLHAIGNLESDEDGTPKRLCGTIQDVTQQRRAEAALAESEARYRLMFENVGDAVFVHAVAAGKPGRFLDVNDRACAMLGCTRDELLRLEVGDIDVPEQLERIPAILDQLLNNGAAAFETEHVAKDGSRIPVDVNTRMFELAGEPVVLSVVRDVRARKMAEQAAAAYAEQLSSLALALDDAAETERRHLAEVLHDGVSQVLAAASIKLGQAVSGSVKCSEGAGAARELILRAIDESRAITGALADPTLYELGLVEALQWEVNRAREIHGLKVKLSTSPTLPELADDRKMLMLRAMRELLANVARHAGVSAARVTLKTRGGRLELSVSDKGQGFEGDQAGKDPGHFGLLSLRERVRSAGGDLTVDSSPGNGATVMLWLPEHERS